MWPGARSGAERVTEAAAERARLLPRAAGHDPVGVGLLRGEARVLAHLPALPHDDAGWKAALAAASAQVPRLPPAAAEALAARQVELGAGPAGVENARRLAPGPGQALAVVTGQQPGLLGGPLLAFHKAAGAVALARRLTALGGPPVVPVFWSASEDHDFDECNQATLLDRHGQARRLSVDEHGDHRSVVDLVVPPEATDALLQEARAALPETERAEAALALLARRAGEGWSAWSQRCLLEVLGDAGLVIVEPRVLAPWLGERYAWLVREGAAVLRAVRGAGAALAADGLPAPLDPHADELPLFLRTALGGPRLRLGEAPDGAVLHDGRPWGGDREALARRAQAEPLLFSADVVGRVFVQNQTLPVVAYLGGPTELGYLAQVAAADRALARRTPLAVPRPSATWVDARTLEAAASFGLTLEQVLAGAGPGPRRAHPGVERFLAGVREALETKRREAGFLVEGGANGARRLRGALDRLMGAWERAVPEIHAGYESDDQVDAGRWARVQALVLPRGRPQERTLSILSLLARYGLEAVRAGLACLDPLADGTWLLRGDLLADA